MHPRTAALERQHALRHRTRAAPDAHPATATEHRRSFWKSGGRISTLAQLAPPLATGLVARTRIRMQRIPEATLGRKRRPGVIASASRSQQAKPLPVDLNPYLRRWADLITCACATFYQAAPPACGFVSQLQFPGPSTL